MRSSSPHRCGCATRLSDLRLFIQPDRTDVLMTVLCVHWGRPAPVDMNSAEKKEKTIYFSIPPIKHAHQLAVERLVNLTAIVKIVRVRLVAVRPVGSPASGEASRNNRSWKPDWFCLKGSTSDDAQSASVVRKASRSSQPVSLSKSRHVWSQLGPLEQPRVSRTVSDVEKTWASVG